MFLLLYHSILHCSNIYDVQWFLSLKADRGGNDVEIIDGHTSIVSSVRGQSTSAVRTDSNCPGQPGVESII